MTDPTKARIEELMAHIRSALDGLDKYPPKSIRDDAPLDHATMVLVECRSAITELATELSAERAERSQASSLAIENARSRDAWREATQGLRARIMAAEAVLDVVHEIRDGGGTLPDELLAVFNPWLEAEGRRVAAAFVKLKTMSAGSSGSVDAAEKPNKADADASAPALSNSTHPVEPAGAIGEEKP